MILNKNEIVSCIVLDVISDKTFDHIDRVFSRMGSNLPGISIFNSKYLSKCPANSVVVKVQNPTRYMILYPFFSSHIALPVKPGEHVWAFFPGGLGSNDIGYWMSRRVTDDFIEDPNFTHNARATYKNYNNALISEGKEGESEKYYDIEGRGVDSYLSLILNTEGNSKHVFESIQRTYKKPGDLVLQGSNNTQVVFTCGDKKETGTLILSAGKGKSELTSIDSIENNAGKEESNKASKLSKIGNENENEGNIDLENDKTYLILSENPVHINKFLPEDAEEESAFDEFSHFILKTDRIRKRAIESILTETKSYDLKTENSTILASEKLNISSPEINADGNVFNVKTEGWSVEMKKLFEIIEETIQELSNLSTGAAVFATGVGPTGPATNAAQISALLSRIKAMRG